MTHDYAVEGPVMIFLTTTAHDVDEELLNRAIVLTVNEDRNRPGRFITSSARRRRSRECGRRTTAPRS